MADKGEIRYWVERCVRCGSCKATCPTYELERSEGMGARGRVVLVGKLMDGEVRPSALLMRRLSSCLLCGQCEPTCPVGVRITETVYHGLSILERAGYRAPMMARMAGMAARMPRLAHSVARGLSPLISMARGIGALPIEAGAASDAIRGGMEVAAEGTRRGRVAIFMGCSVRYTTPDWGRRLVRVLARGGYDVIVPEGEVCCGAPMMQLGQESEAVARARYNLGVFDVAGADAVLSLCPTCTMYIRKNYAGLVGRGVDNAVDAMKFIVDAGIEVRPSGLVREGARVAYHEPCHLGAGLGVKSEPRKIITGALGLELIGRRTAKVNAPHGGGALGACCGFGQVMHNRDIADAMVAGCVEAYEGAEAVMTACPGCVMGLKRGGLQAHHIIEAIA